MTAQPAIRESDLLPRPDGRFRARTPHGVLSVQPNGTCEERGPDTDGAWEVFERQGNKAVFTDGAYGLTGCYVLLIVT